MGAADPLISCRTIRDVNIVRVEPKIFEGGGRQWLAVLGGNVCVYANIGGGMGAANAGRLTSCADGGATQADRLFEPRAT